MIARFIRQSVIRKLLTFIVIGTLILSGAIGYLYLYRQRAALEEAEFAKLNLLWSSKRQELISWFRNVVDDLAFMGHSHRVRASVDDLTKPDADPDQVKWGLTGLTQFFQTYLDLNLPEEGFEDLLLINSKTGKVVYSQNKLPESSNDLNTGDLKDTGIARIWEQVIKNQKPAVSDFYIFPPTGTPMAFAGVPVHHGYPKELLGVLVARLNANRVNEILALGEGSGKSSKIYVVGKDLVMRSQSGPLADSTVLKKKADTEPVALAWENKKVSKVSKDYRGVTTLAVAGLIGLNHQEQFSADFDWVMVSELDRREAMQRASSLALWVQVLAILIAVIVAGGTFLLARGIATPIVDLARVATAVSKGDLSVDVPHYGKGDEIGSLEEAFRTMVGNLRDQIGRVADGVKVLNVSASEISATADQLSFSASNTSSAVTETSTTVEEVKQSAEITRTKASRVKIASQEAVTVTSDGRTAAEDTIERMRLIKKQMESIGENVLKLSEQSQAIEAIIASVQDLADQSNLLAVNASIEAARAGEQGKGFTVVANEIGSLAGQSRSATKEIQSILDSTRQWIRAVVIAVDEGGKAVDAGVEQAVTAGESIQLLADSVSRSSDEANIIGESNEQQFVGVAQVSTAMADIEQAMRQNLDGTTKLKELVDTLEKLGHTLEQLVERYNV